MRRVYLRSYVKRSCRTYGGMSILNLDQFFQKNTYQNLYRKSEIRENLLSWYPFGSEQAVLILGEEKTSLVQMIKERVQSVELLQPEALKNHVKKYHMILHVGSLDCKGRQAERVYAEYFRQCREHLKEQGVLLLALDNRLGLRYFAGNQDENYDVYFAGPEGYEENQTVQALSYKRYLHLLKQADFLHVESYYPYPDYRFPIAIYSERHLPSEGELNQNIRNFDRDRYVLFDEGKVFDGLIREGLFREFSNSYLFVAFSDERAREQFEENRVLYSKYSNERSKQYQIRTDIVSCNGKKQVAKCPLQKDAQAHVRKMEEIYSRLSNENGLSEIRFCETKYENGVALSPFAKGVPLQELLIEAMQENRIQDATELIQLYITRMRAYFAARKQNNDVMTDIDMVFSNILVDGDNWNVIDYEWSFVENIPEDFVIYRALFRASIELPKQNWNSLPQLLAMAGISEEQAVRFQAGEEAFQSYITAEQTPLRDMVDRLGNQVLSFSGKQSEEAKEAEKLRNLWEQNTKEVFFSIDQYQMKNGKAYCVGWACGMVGKYQFIPVHVRIFNQDGVSIKTEIRCNRRGDVKQSLEAKDKFPELWGFDAMWTVKPGDTYKIRFSSGAILKEETLREK